MVPWKGTFLTTLKQSGSPVLYRSFSFHSYQSILIFSVLFFFETVSQANQAYMELLIFLLLPSRCWTPRPAAYRKQARIETGTREWGIAATRLTRLLWGRRWKEFGTLNCKSHLVFRAQSAIGRDWEKGMLRAVQMMEVWLVNF